MTVWRYDSMTLWRYDSMMVWRYDSVMVWKYDSMTVWWYERMTVLWYDGMMVWKYVSRKVWQYDGMTVWWYDSITVRAAENIFCLVSRFFWEQFVLQSEGFQISQNATKCRGLYQNAPLTMITNLYCYNLGQSKTFCFMPVYCLM